MPRQNRVRAIHLTLARPLAILCAMRRVPGTTAASRSDLSTRRDLLLEILALRHQLAVLARSNRRFRTSDRLLWLMLRRLWPRWRDALSLVQPATVDRWHRDRLHRWWRRRSRTRRPGRPPINEECRALIRCMADDNRHWARHGFTASCSSWASPGPNAPCHGICPSDCGRRHRPGAHS